MKFTFDTATKKKPTAKEKLRVALGELPDGKLVDSRRLAELAGISYGCLKEHIGAEEFEPFKAWHNGHALVWGNAATIAAFRKQVGK